MRSKSVRRRTVSVVASVASLALIGGVLAQFTSSTASDPQKIGTGTLAMTLDNVAPVVWTDDISNMAADDRVTRFVDLRNSGTLELANISISQTNKGGLLATRDDGVDISFESCSVAWTTSDGSCAGTTSVLMAPVLLKTWAGRALPVQGLKIPVGSTVHLRETVHLSNAATNDLQAAVESVVFTFNGTQSSATLPAPSGETQGEGSIPAGGIDWGNTGNGNTAPVPPVGSARSVSASSTDSGNVVSWPIVDGASGYRVWRCVAEVVGTPCVPDVSSAALVQSTTTPQITDVDLAPNSTYSYVVKAYDARGDGAVSQAATATTSPAALTDLLVSRITSSATLTFANPSGAAVRIVTEGPGAPAEIITDAGATSAVVTGLQSGASYIFTLTAGTDYGTSAAITSAQIDPSIPTAPVTSQLTVDDGAGTATFGWSAVEGASGYEVYRDGALVDETSQLSYSEQVDFSVAHTYRVLAKNVAGSGEASTVLTYAPAFASAVRNISAETTTSGAIVRFSAPESLGSGGLVGYEVTIDNGGVFSTVTAPANASLVTIDNIVASGAPVSFSVRAVSKSGLGMATSVMATAPSLDGVITTEFVQTSTAYSCPTGGTLNGSACDIPAKITAALATVNHSCDPGATLIGTTCTVPSSTRAATGTINYSCPTGGALGGTTCTIPVKTYVATGTVNYSCPSGGTLGGTTCTVPSSTYAATANTSYSCPSGGSLNGTSCTIPSSSYAASSNTSYSCPSGGSLSGSTCYTSSSYGASSSTSYSCPSGGSLSGSTCIRSTSYAATGTYVAPYKYCIVGFTLVGNSCVGSKTTVPASTAGGTTTYSCPSGGSLSGTTCTTNSNYAASSSTSYSCPSGGSRSGTTCTISSSYAASASTTYSCPSGGTRSGTTCTFDASSYTATSSTSYSCNTGNSLSGTTCTIPVSTYTATGTTTYSCPTGGTLGASTCTVPSSTYTATGTTVYSCPDGGTLGASTCTVPSSTYVATSNTTYSCATGESNAASATTCVKPESTYVATATTTYSCSSGDVLAGSTCTTPARSYAATATAVGYTDHILTLKDVTGAQKTQIAGSLANTKRLGACPGQVSASAIGVGGTTTKSFAIPCAV